MIQLPIQSRHGFTLIETVISLSIMSVLMLGLSAAIMISSKAIPTTTQIGIEDQKVIDALNQLRNEARQAVQLHYNWTDLDLHIHLKMDQSRAKGTPEIIEYHYRIAAKTFTRMYKEGIVLGTEYTLFDQVSDGAFKVTQDGADASLLYMMFSIDNTLQPIFETHIALPNKPVLDKKAGSK